MKKIVLLLMAALCTAFVSAQGRPFATLNHNDSISVFYGTDALKQAHSAAVTNDIITLSSGRFDATTITKAITLRGAGMWDDIWGNKKTEIGYIYIDIQADTNNIFLCEGIKFNDVNARHLKKSRFEKCDFKIYYYDTLINAKIINCLISCPTKTRNYVQNISIINSVVFFRDEGWGIEYHNIAYNLLNCIADISVNSCTNHYIENSITHSYYGSGTENGITSYNSIGVTGDNDYHFFDTIYTPDHNLRNFVEYQSVFKTFDGRRNYDYISYYISDCLRTGTRPFELQDNIANTILGTDGTQVGIYGGPYPFSSNVRNPRIKRCNVAQRSTPDNKLSIDIEVISE